VSVPKDRAADLVLENRLPDEIAAPFAAGTEVGRAVVLLDGRELGGVPLVTAEAVEKGNWFHRLLN
jgi:D-alanyl-D-alanine carboxypeptidase (penicillin-binding protein 5/6)